MKTKRDCAKIIDQLCPVIATHTKAHISPALFDALTKRLSELLTVQKVCVRWRKTTATWVIYVAGIVLESGFESREQAQDYLEQFHPAFAKRAVYA